MYTRRFKLLAWCASKDHALSVQVHSIQIRSLQAEAVILHAGLYSGASLIRLPEGLQPDFGPTALDPRHGFAAVGAVPWVVNYNVLLHTEDMQACRSIAKAISTKGGGLPSVEAMALQHDKGKLLWCVTQCHGCRVIANVVLSPSNSNCASSIGFQKAQKCHADSDAECC